MNDQIKLAAYYEGFYERARQYGLSDYQTTELMKSANVMGNPAEMAPDLQGLLDASRSSAGIAGLLSRSSGGDSSVFNPGHLGLGAETSELPHASATGPLGIGNADPSVPDNFLLRLKDKFMLDPQLQNLAKALGIGAGAAGLGYGASQLMNKNKKDRE
jgi:hypothetical protein